MQLGQIDQMCVRAPPRPARPPARVHLFCQAAQPERASMLRYGKTAANGGLNITYTYSYGCQNAFTMMITPLPAGQKPLPAGTVEYTDCDYSLRWTTNAEKTDTCSPPRVPPSECETSLRRLCSGAKRSSKGNCFICTGQHQQAFLQAHCAQHDFDDFCNA